MPALALIKSSLIFESLLVFKLGGIEGAYPEPGAIVDELELLGCSGGSILMCSSKKFLSSDSTEKSYPSVESISIHS